MFLVVGGKALFIMVVLFLDYHQRPTVLYIAGKRISKCNKSA